MCSDFDFGSHIMDNYVRIVPLILGPEGVQQSKNKNFS